MVSILEAIAKLPPKERIEKLKSFLKGLIESKEQEKEEAESVLTKSIEELTKQQQEEEEEEEQTKKDLEKEDSLEDIAEEAEEEEKTQEEEHAYQLQQTYRTELSQRPTSELYQSAAQIQDARTQRGYNTQEEYQNAQNIKGALEEKRNSGYRANERSREMMNSTDKMLEKIRNPTNLTEEYR